MRAQGGRRFGNGPALVVFSVATLAAATAPEGVRDGGFRGWPVVSGDPRGCRSSALDQTHRGTVKDREVAWIFHPGDAETKPASTIECTPIVEEGTMYLTTPGLKVVALEAATG